LAPLVGSVVSVGGWASGGGALLPTNRRQMVATIKRFTM